jgi:TonB-linked SusC/RagA family outer membrane protein
MKELCKKQFSNLLLLGIMLFSSFALNGQQGTITGTVTDANGEPIIGANIFIEGTTEGTVSDIDGNFTLPVTTVGTLNITASFVGYLKETQPVNVSDGGTSTINFLLVEDLQQLSEVVVIGYGTIKKSDLTGAVSSVKPEDLTQLSTVSVQQAMQGRVAGVQVSANTGAPGDGTKVRIRGISTINNSDPLYVVDGFPVGDISYIAPSDVERMEVLKDASATAIYGNRGANGVVLITTKKGNSQGTRVNFDTYYGIIQQPERIPVLDAKGYAEAKYMAYDGLAETRNNDNLRLRGNPSAAVKDSAFQDAIDRNFGGTDWQNEVMRPGSVQNYTLNISGGSEKYKYNVSGSYYREDGIVNNSWHRRYLLRYASNFEVTKRIDAELITSYRNFEQTNYDQDIYGQGVIPPALYADPISPAFNPDGTYGAVDWSQTTNPIAAADRNIYNRNKGDQFVINLGLNVDIVKGLTFQSKFGTDMHFQRPKRYIPTYNIGTKDARSQSQLEEDHQRDFSWNNSNYFNYNLELSKHSLNLMAGQEWSYKRFDKTRLITFDVPNDPNLFFATAASFTTPAQINTEPGPLNRYEWETALSSFFGRVFYSYNSRYLITGTVRRDGTSKMSPDYRWGYFPSFSLGWNLKNESFMENVELLSSLKLRVGWGKTGNEGSVTNPYLTYASVSPGLYIVGQNDEQLQGQLQTFDPNIKLQWEIVKQWNYAVDFGLLNNKLIGTVDFFQKYTEGMIITPPPPLFKGGNASDGNVGAMENQGVEISLNYRNSDNPFKYEIGGNVTFLKLPMVTKLTSDDQEIIRGTAAKIRGVTLTKAGEEMAYFYGFKTDGLLSQDDIDNTFREIDGETVYTYEDFYAGNLKIVDLNDDGVIGNDDKTNIGSGNPDLMFALNLNLEYMGFDLKLFFDAVYGHEMINTMNVWLKVPDEGDGNLHEEVLNSWTEDNQNTTVPRLVQGNNIFNSYFNDYLVEDASYFRLKNAQLGYTLPGTLTGKIGVDRLRIYISGENLFTLTEYSGYSPELGHLQYSTELGRNDPLSQGLDDGSYPVTRRFLFGLNLTF